MNRLQIVISVVFGIAFCIGFYFFNKRDENYTNTMLNPFKRKPKEPLIPRTQWGPVSEAARRQCAMNMRENPVLRAKIEEALAQKEGSMEAGIAESKKRYREAYD